MRQRWFVLLRYPSDRGEWKALTRPHYSEKSAERTAERCRVELGAEATVEKEKR